MFKILLLIIVSCSGAYDLPLIRKQPSLVNIHLGSFYNDIGSYSNSGDLRLLILNNLNDAKTAGEWKDEEGRTLLMGFLIYSCNDCFRVNPETIYNFLEVLLDINKNQLWNKDKYGNTFLHYLPIFTASLWFDKGEDFALSILKKVEYKNHDSCNDMGYSQAMLAEILGLKRLSKAIKSKNSRSLYSRDKEELDAINGRHRTILMDENNIAEGHWSEKDAYTFVIKEILGSDSFQASISLIGYCLSCVNDDLRCLICNGMYRKKLIDEDDKLSDKDEESTKWHKALNYAGAYGQDMIKQAARLGDVRLVNALLLKGCHEPEKSQALYVAAEHGQLSAVEALLQAGADPNIQYPYVEWTPVCVATDNGHEAVVRRLLQVPNIDLDAPEEGGITPIYLASKSNERDILKLLISAGASVKKGAPIYGAISGKKVSKEILEMLLDKQANLDCIFKPSPSSTGNTPLQHAVGNYDVELVEKFLSRGANPNFYSDIWHSPIYLVDRDLSEVGDDPQKISKIKNIKSLLLSHGAQYNIKFKDGMYSIHKIAQSKFLFIPETLAVALDESGCDVDQVDANGKTALYYAGKSFCQENAIVLSVRGASWEKARKAGLDVTELDKLGGRSWLHILADKGHFQTILNMNLSKENLNALSRNGKTILTYAVSKNAPTDIIERLINYGCRLDIRGKSKKGKLGELLIEIPLRFKRWEMFKCLYQKMAENLDTLQLLKSKELKAEMDKKCTKDVEAFIVGIQKKVADEAKGKGQKRKAPDGRDGPPPKKQEVTNSKKRKADGDNEAKPVKKAKVAQTVKKGTGKKK